MSVITRFALVMCSLACVGAGCAPAHPVEDLVSIKSRGTITAGSDNKRIREKVVAWAEIRTGNCHQTSGTLIIRSDGTAHFECVTWTEISHSAGNHWFAGFRMQDREGVTLHHEPYHAGPEMHDAVDHPGPHHRWGFDFTYDASKFDLIAQIWQDSKC